REVHTRAARDVDHGVTRPKAERSNGPDALCPQGVTGRGIEPGGDVEALRLPAVHLDQTLLLSRPVELAHGALPDLVGAADSTAALIAAISRSLTRWMLALRTPGAARMIPARSTSIHIVASVCRSPSGTSSIPQ